MELREAKARFIQDWGTFGSKWGVNRTMAQVHALLLISPESMSADEVMEELKISRGNANMNLRALIDWGLARKELKAGQRREFFVAEKDIWKVARQIMRERKRRELDPIRTTIDDLQLAVRNDDSREAEAFKDMLQQIGHYTNQADKTLQRIIKSDEHWLVNQFMQFMIR